MFKIGTEYSTKSGKFKYKVVAVVEDGKLVVEYQNPNPPIGGYAPINYLEADGSYPPNPGFGLVNPDEPTEEEREKIAQIFEAFHWDQAARLCREKVKLEFPQSSTAEKILKVLRK